MAGTYGLIDVPHQQLSPLPALRVSSQDAICSPMHNKHHTARQARESAARREGGIVRPRTTKESAQDRWFMKHMARGSRDEKMSRYRRGSAQTSTMHQPQQRQSTSDDQARA